MKNAAPFAANKEHWGAPFSFEKSVLDLFTLHAWHQNTAQTVITRKTAVLTITLALQLVQRDDSDVKIIIAMTITT